MDFRLSRLFGAFAVFFILALPLFAAAAAAGLHSPLLEMCVRAGSPPAGALADFFFAHFRLALAVPVSLATGGGVAAFLIWRRTGESDPVALGKLMVLQTLTACVSLVWFALYLLALVKR